MLLLNNIKAEDVAVEPFYFLNNHEFYVKVKGPTFNIGNTFNLSFQPMLAGYNNQDIKDNFNVLLFPIIPQYFHNVFEMFTKVIKLKNNGENFKVVLVFDENYYGLNQEEGNKKTNGIFNFLIRDLGAPGPNSAHIKDFLDYINVKYICLTVEELQQFQPLACYLFFDDGVYYEQDPYIFVDDKKYNLANFLKVPNLHITLKDIDDLRYVFPKSYVSKTKKIFISRKKTRDRKYQYEEQLDLVVKSLGYETLFLEDMSILDQIRVLQTSSHIICPYGSALVNGCLLGPQNNILAINYTSGYRVKLYEDFFEKYQVPYTEINIDNNFDPTEFLLNFIPNWENKGLPPKNEG